MSQAPDTETYDPDDTDVVDAEIVPMSEALPEVTEMTEDEAQQLTNQIRSSAEALMTLLWRAHAGRAWIALGYQTFEAYVRDEFDMSRSRAYQLLSAEKVRAAIESAVPDGTDFRLTEAQARDLKSVAGEVAGVIEEATAGMNPDEAGPLVEDMIEEHRTKVRERDDQEKQDQAEDAAARRGNAEYGDGSYQQDPEPEPVNDGLDPKILRRNVQGAYDLYTAITALSTMPEPSEVVGVIPRERRFQIAEALRPAGEWLEQFRDLWEAQAWQQEQLGED